MIVVTATSLANWVLACLVHVPFVTFSVWPLHLHVLVLQEVACNPDPDRYPDQLIRIAGCAILID